MEEKLKTVLGHGARGITYWTIGDELPGYYAMVKKYHRSALNDRARRRSLAHLVELGAVVLPLIGLARDPAGQRFRFDRAVARGVETEIFVVLEAFAHQLESDRLDRHVALAAEISSGRPG